MKISLSLINQLDRNRLDNFILEELTRHPEFSSLTRSQLKNLIVGQGVLVNKNIINKAGHQLKVQDAILIDWELYDRSKELLPYDYPLDVVYEDADLLVINKSADLSVHPGAGNPNRTLLNALIQHVGPGQSVFLVHRLDKDTTGLILAAKTEASRAALVKQFASREVKRVYQALALVTPRSNREIQKSSEGKIETLTARNPRNKLEMAVVSDRGRVSITNWKVIERFPYAYLLELRLETGRTHQIRVHLEHLRSPIIGDQTYGEFNLLPKELRQVAEHFGRQALHAKEIEFIHPTSEQRMSFQTELPSDFKDLINKFAKFR